MVLYSISAVFITNIHEYYGDMVSLSQNLNPKASMQPMFFISHTAHSFFLQDAGQE
jgi:hypothetical protein